MQTERIKYPMGALTAEGALIYDENVSGKRPAVLLAPNWMGVTDTAINGVSWWPKIATWFSLPTCTAPVRDRQISARQPPWPTHCAQTPSSSVAALKRHSRR